MHVLSTSIAQAFVFRVWEKRIQLLELYSKKLWSYFHNSYGPTSNKLCPGPAGCLRHFGTAQRNVATPKRLVVDLDICSFGVATNSRRVKSISLFHKEPYKRDLYCAKEAYILKEPTNCCVHAPFVHSIFISFLSLSLSHSLSPPSPNKKTILGQNWKISNCCHPKQVCFIYS